MLCLTMAIPFFPILKDVFLPMDHVEALGISLEQKKIVSPNVPN